MSKASLAALAGGLALAACGPPGGEPSAAIGGLTPGTWTWVDVPGSACDDGSGTGIGVSPGSGPDLVLFLNGGGACWDYLTCYVLGTARHGPFGEPQFLAVLASLAGSILDRTLPGNPFADATLVFVPYCTGDNHGGDNVVAYPGPGETRIHRHVGHPNLVAALRRLAATWPAPRKLAILGASAGGFGALVNYDTCRRAWPAAQGFLVDDSGPPLQEGDFPQGLLDAWIASWRLDLLLDPLCGQACRTDPAAALAALEVRYPLDRLALLSSLQDSVIASYYASSGAGFEAALLRMAADVIDPAPNARVFLVAGNTHTMLGNPAGFAQGVALVDWLGQQLNGDPAWVSRRP